ncbi:MAG: hypothetical protein KDA92_16655, partial [Planctomycetales bacterium]|nr:hypothetical protein [Planctomycetales bacterium]
MGQSVAGSENAAIAAEDGALTVRSQVRRNSLPSFCPGDFAAHAVRTAAGAFRRTTSELMS